MKTENQVCTAQQSERLKELGVTAPSLHVWYKMKYPASEEAFAKNRANCLITPTGDSHDRFIMHYIDNENAAFHWSEGTYTDGWDHSRCELEGEGLPAYTVAELAEMLPKYYPTWRFPIGDEEKWVATVICSPKPPGIDDIHTAHEFDRFGDTQAEALATLLIALLETEVITPEEVNNRLNNL